MPPELAIPFQRSYWVLPGRLLAGCYPGDRNIRRASEKASALIDAGVTYVLNLMEERERDHAGALFTPYSPILLSIAEARGVLMELDSAPIADGGVPTVSTMRDIIDRLHCALSAGRLAYVHCWGGVGRTGVVVGCFLVSHGMASGDQAMKRLQELRRNDPFSWRPSPENELQRRFIRNWR